MKKAKVIISLFMAVIIASAMCLSCFAVTYSQDKTNHIVESGNIIDDDGVLPVGTYSEDIMVTVTTGKTEYTFNVSPVSGPNANVAIYYKMRVHNYNYCTLNTIYGGYLIDNPNPVIFKQFAYNYIVMYSYDSMSTVLDSYNGAFSSVSVSKYGYFNGFTENHYYYFDVDLCGEKGTSFYGEANYDVVGIAHPYMSDIHLYY